MVLGILFVAPLGTADIPSQPALIGCMLATVKIFDFATLQRRTHFFTSHDRLLNNLTHKIDSPPQLYKFTTYKYLHPG
jgi:hypothetical protein